MAEKKIVEPMRPLYDVLEYSHNEDGSALVVAVLQDSDEEHTFSWTSDNPVTEEAINYQLEAWAKSKLGIE